MASHSGRKLRGGLTSMGSGDRRLKAHRFGDRPTVNNRRITARPITFTKKQKEESILAAPLDNSVAQSSAIASKPSSVSRRNKHHETVDENQGISTNTTNPRGNNSRGSNVLISKNPQITPRSLHGRDVPNDRDNFPLEIASVELHHGEDVNSTAAAIVEIMANPILPVLDELGVNVSNRTAVKKTGASSAKASNKRKALQEKHSVGNAVIVPSPVKGISTTRSELEADGEAGTSNSGIRLGRTVVSSTKANNERKAVQEKHSDDNAVLVPSLLEGGFSARLELDVVGEAGTSNSGFRLGRELTGLVKSVFKSPLLDLSTKSGKRLKKSVDYCSSSEDFSNNEMSIERAKITRSTLTRTKNVVEMELAANRNKSVENSNLRSNETRTKVASSKQRNKSSGKTVSKNAIISKESDLKKSLAVLQSKPKSLQESSQRASNGETKDNRCEKYISSPLQQNISVCASVYTEPSDPASQLTFNSVLSAHNPECSPHASINNISRSLVPMSAAKQRSTVQDVTLQSTRMEMPDDELHASVGGERQLTGGEMSVQMSASGKRSIQTVSSRSNINLLNNPVDYHPITSHETAASDSRATKTAEKTTSSASAVSVATELRDAVISKHVGHGRKNTNRRKQPSPADDEDEDEDVENADVARPSAARRKRQKLSHTAEVDLILPIVKESVNDVLNDMKANKQAKSALKEMAKRVVTSVEERISEKSTVQSLKRTMSQIKSQEMTQRKQLLKKRQELARLKEEQLALDERLKKEQVFQSIVVYLSQLRMASRQTSPTSDS